MNFLMDPKYQQEEANDDKACEGIKSFVVRETNEPKSKPIGEYGCGQNYVGYFRDPFSAKDVCFQYDESRNNTGVPVAFNITGDECENELRIMNKLNKKQPINTKTMVTGDRFYFKDKGYWERYKKDPVLGACYSDFTSAPLGKSLMTAEECGNILFKKTQAHPLLVHPSLVHPSESHTKGRCGPQFGHAKCPSGECCSMWGWCGGNQKEKSSWCSVPPQSLGYKGELSAYDGESSHIEGYGELVVDCHKVKVEHVMLIILIIVLAIVTYFYYKKNPSKFYWMA